MPINNQIINPDKIAKTFGIKYKKTNIFVALKDQPSKKAFQFSLNEKDKKPSIELFFNPELPNTLLLHIETLNGYLSNIEFNDITRVRCVPEYRKVIFESHTKSHFSVLEIYWRGQFNLHSGLEEKIYPETTWAKQ